MQAETDGSEAPANPGPEDLEPAPWGVLCALPEELGPLAARVTARRNRQGLELLELDLAARSRVTACVGGVGKVLAARAATLLLAEGATAGLLMVGVCGAVSRGLAPGTLVHATVAVQTDLSTRPGRESASDPALAAAWRSVAGGSAARFLTGDRAVLSTWRRRGLRRAYPGPAVCDMETAAAAAVAELAGVPWAALRAVVDAADGAAAGSFRRHFPTLAGRAADTLPGLLSARLPLVPAPRWEARQGSLEPGSSTPSPARAAPPTIDVGRGSPNSDR